MPTPIEKVQQEFESLKEKTELLDGSRNTKTQARAAVRFSDLSILSKFPTSPTSTQVTAAPTMDDFNALQADVKRIWDALAAISGNVTPKV